MAQIATTHDKKPVDQPRTNADRAADLARDARDQGRKLAHDVAETTSSMVKRTVANTVAAAGSWLVRFLCSARRRSPAMSSPISGASWHRRSSPTISTRSASSLRRALGRNG